ncbi:hypothetical protein BV25DRAFT_1830874 [Artomyces pyxidatus]|uniref:Uncharacterized protein n=1 Tax=Artomyces pyxidatus TaxID=48021 RepID=A0ACB8SMM3_9AGAM|nr:hypothetical protein BV25DRAFT_1830874 [Artomyces pyxidatus]
MAGNKFAPHCSMPKPSAFTTPLARFNLDRPRPPTTASAALRAFAEARCEVESEPLWMPIFMETTDSMLAVLGAGGLKQRDPCLQLIRLDGPPKDKHLNWGLNVDLGLASTASDMMLDGSRRLVYAADNRRIKSYRWGESKDESLPVHTMDSAGYDGPITSRDGGAKLLRGGREGIAVWDVDELPTHGEKGEGIVGKKIRVSSWRDDDDEVERSAGSAPSQRVNAETLASIALWKEHPANPQEMLITHSEQFKLERVDIQTNPDDPASFATASRDGAVRMYDARLPAPTLAIFHDEETIHSALYKHIGGQPCEFCSVKPMRD